MPRTGLDRLDRSLRGRSPGLRPGAGSGPDLDRQPAVPPLGLRVRILAGGPGAWVFWTGRDLGRDETFFSRFDGAAWSPAAGSTRTSLSPISSWTPPWTRRAGPGSSGPRTTGRTTRSMAPAGTGRAWSERRTLTDDRDSDAFPVPRLSPGPAPSSSGPVHGRPRSRPVLAPAPGGRRSRSSRAGRAIADPGPPSGTAGWSSPGGPEASSSRWPGLRGAQGRRAFLPPPDPNGPRRGPDENGYIAFGDEITFGWIDGGPAPNSDTSRGSRRSSRNFGPSEVVNEGVPGETTVNGLGRMSDVLASECGPLPPPDGGNQRRRLPELSIDATAFNLEQMVLKCLDAGVLPVLATIIPRNDVYWTRRRLPETDRRPQRRTSAGSP